MNKNFPPNIIIYSVIIGVLHHLFHWFAQPWLNTQFPDLWKSLPEFMLGSTSAVTIYIIIITIAYGTILIKNK
jgi:hypothetical protein